MINSRGLIFASLLLLGMLTSAENLDYTKLKVPAEDQTEIFYNRYYNRLSGIDESELRQLQGSEVILVPGFLGEWIQNWKGYFDPIKQWLSKNSIPFQVAETRSTRPSQENAANIRKLLQSAADRDRPVFIIAHSRGGIDTLLALTENLPRVRIQGIVILQSPLYGTWVSDAVAQWCLEETSALSPDRESFPIDCMSKIIALTGGKEKPREIVLGLWNTIMGMKSKPRLEWMKTHQQELMKIFDRENIPLVSIATKDEGSQIRWTPYEIFRRRMWGIGISNDGVVPSSSMKVPGTSFILLKENVDHSTLVENREQKSGYQDRIYETTFDLLMDGSLHPRSIH